MANAVRAYKSDADQAVASGAFPDVNFNNEVFDTDGFHSITTNTQNFTIPANLGGLYYATASVLWASGTTSTRKRSLTICINGTSETAYCGFTRSSSDGAVCCCSSLILCSPGDVITARVFNTTAGSLGITAFQQETQFSMIRLGLLEFTGTFADTLAMATAAFAGTVASQAGPLVFKNTTLVLQAVQRAGSW